MFVLLLIPYIFVTAFNFKSHLFSRNTHGNYLVFVVPLSILEKYL